VRLAHLSLAVADQQRSRRFYEVFFGFECSGELDSDGCLHVDAGDFDLTLVAQADVSPPRSLHFGVRVGDPAGELFDSDRRVAFHCTDPDGYQVEVFWAETFLG
jgi:catechol 2,3-dioxygenase-like lactoylglutathione lyase family enzyme